MALTSISGEEELTRTHYLPETDIESWQINNSAISWAAILAGAAAAAALSLILLLLGAGIGLSSISPWAQKGIEASTFGVSTIIWITVTQLLAAGMGGYLAGRLRTRWANVDADEVYFRDTAHGFLAWSVATLVTAVLITSTVGSIISGGVQAVSTITGGAANAAVAGGVLAAGGEGSQPDNASGFGTGAMGYFVDSLFRQDDSFAMTTSSEINNTSLDTAQQAPATGEVTRIFINSMDKEALPQSDLSYISQLVSRHTGLTPQEAETRVNDIYGNLQASIRDAEIAAKEAADKARKASIYTTLWLFVSLLIGAFSASLAATWGGRCRDT